MLDKVLFPTQLIVTKELDREAHMWLRSLSNHLEKQARREVEKSRQEAEQLRREAKKEAVQTAKKMLKSGKFSVEETRECVPRLSVEEIRAIAKELGQI